MVQLVGDRTEVFNGATVVLLVLLLVWAGSHSGSPQRMICHHLAS